MQKRVRLHETINRTANQSKVDLKDAQRFLGLLGAKHCCFQTFDDNAERKNPKLARILHGKLDEHADELIRLNALGAGVFVAVNQTDEEGRKRANIKRVRAVTADLDGAPLDPVLACKLKPHMVVESSPGRYHGYWIVKGLPLDLFEDVQRAIAKAFDGDPDVAKLTHCARLPGFYHGKGEPFRTRVIETNDLPAYTAEQIIKEFPPLVKAHKASISEAGHLIVPSDDPVTAALIFVDHRFRTSSGALTLQRHCGIFYRWVDTHYAEVDANEMRAELYEFLKDAVTPQKDKLVPFKPTKSKVNQILDALEAGVLQPRDKVPPFWMGKAEDNPFAECSIACRNGMLDLATRELVPHDPRLFNINCLPFDYDPDAPAYPAAWMKFLRELWPDDQEARIELQRIFGYLLTPDTQHQKIFLIHGPKRSGKGTIARVLTALLGKENVAGPTLASLSKNFGLSPLIGKTCAIIADARLSTRADGSVVTERFLSISGEDTLTIDRKYQQSWTGKLGTRFVVLTNELPRLADSSGALASRFILLTITNSFYGREDLGLLRKLLKGLPGILNWALDGLDRLHRRRYFKNPKSSEDAIRTMEDLASPVNAFTRDWCVLAPNQSCKTLVLFDAYAKWCGVEGHMAGSNVVFGRNLKAAHPHLRYRGRGEDRAYVGIGLGEYGQERYEALRRLG